MSTSGDTCACRRLGLFYFIFPWSPVSNTSIKVPKFPYAHRSIRPPVYRQVPCFTTVSARQPWPLVECGQRTEGCSEGLQTSFQCHCSSSSCSLWLQLNFEKTPFNFTMLSQIFSGNPINFCCVYFISMVRDTLLSALTLTYPFFSLHCSSSSLFLAIPAQLPMTRHLSTWVTKSEAILLFSPQSDSIQWSF